MSDESLQLLLDERAITGVAVRYCHALDTRDWQLLATVFLDDATAELGGSGKLVGVGAIVDTCRSALSALDASHHMVTNHEIAIDGDTATHRCYIQAQHVRRDVEGGKNFIIAGCYEDRLVRVAEGWKIAHRDLMITWTEGNRRVVAPRQESPPLAE